LSRFSTLLEVFRAQALDQAKAASAGVRPDVTLAEVELLPPLLAPEKILCIGINYQNRERDYDFSEQLDYEGEIALVIGRECKHVPKERALGVIAGLTLCNEGTLRDWIRHGKFNVTKDKNFDASGSIGP